MSTWARSTRSSPISHKSVQSSLMRVLADSMRRDRFCDSCVTHPPGLMCASIPYGAFVAHVNTLCEALKALHHKDSRLSTGPKNTFHGNGRPGFMGLTSAGAGRPPMHKNGRIMALTSTDATFSTERADPNHARTESGTTDPRAPWHYPWWITRWYLRSFHPAHPAHSAEGDVTSTSVAGASARSRHRGRGRQGALSGPAPVRACTGSCRNRAPIRRHFAQRESPTATEEDGPATTGPTPPVRGRRPGGRDR